MATRVELSVIQSDDLLSIMYCHLSQREGFAVNDGFCMRCRYLEIMQAEGLEISQPGLDSQSSKIHHQITRRHPHMIAHK